MEFIFSSYILSLYLAVLDVFVYNFLAIYLYFMFWRAKGANHSYTRLYCVLTARVCLFVRRKQSSPEPPRREVGAKPEALANGKWSGSSHSPQHLNYGMPSPKSSDYDDAEEEHQTETMDRRCVVFSPFKLVQMPFI